MKRLIALFMALLLMGGAAVAQKKDTYRVRTLVIDPGHGGAKPGAQGSRSWEKDITLSVAKKFGQLVADNYPDVKVVYTRTTDADISLAERARIANRAKADLFISIHANSHPTSSPTGVETFVMGLSESKANLEVAQKENADILLEADYKSDSYYQGFDPSSPESYVVLTMFQNEYLTKSLNLAQAIQSQYKQNLRTINRGVKQAELFVLYKTAMPSVLTEIGFISNPTEEAFMLSDEGQAKIAVCLFNAFMNFKSAEEGSARIANPVIRIKGYAQPEAPKAEPSKAEAAAPVAAAQPEAPKQVIVAVADTIAAAPAAQPEPEAAPAQPAVQPQPAPEEAPAPAPVAQKPSKPLPPVALAERVAPEPEPTPEPAPAPEAAPAQEAQPEPAAKPAKEVLVPPANTADSGATHYYTVQFLTLGTLHKAGARELEGITDFHTFRQGSTYAYVTGRFATMQEAQAYAAHLRRTTSFRDAWAYLYKGAPAKAKAQPQPAPKPAEAAPAEAAPAAKPAAQPAQPAAKQQGVVYRVQFLTSTKLLKKGDPDLCGITDFRSARSGKFYLYTAGNYTSRAEAEQRCATLKRTTPFRDAFVVGFRNGQRINID